MADSIGANDGISGMRLRRGDSLRFVGSGHVTCTTPGGSEGVIWVSVGPTESGIGPFIDDVLFDLQAGDTGLTWAIITGSFSNVGPSGPIGPAGPAGPKGDTGDKGDQGDQGADGTPGDKGDTGLPGPKGDTGTSGTTGPTGAKGDKGDPGVKGDTGLQGPPGVAGATGAPGADGAPGAKGDTGATGPKGDTPTIAYGFATTPALLLNGTADVTIPLDRTMPGSTYEVHLMPGASLIGNTTLTVKSKSMTAVVVTVKATLSLGSTSTIGVLAVG